MTILDKLSPELIEIIISFLTNQEIKHISTINKEYYHLITETLSIGWVYDQKISECNSCRRYKLHPLIITLQIAGYPKEYQHYNLCSDRCKCKLFYRFPRCFFCLNIITYKQFDHTLYCSRECVEKSSQNLSREKYIS